MRCGGTFWVKAFLSVECIVEFTAKVYPTSNNLEIVFCGVWKLCESRISFDYPMQWRIKGGRGYKAPIEI